MEGKGETPAGSKDSEICIGTCGFSVDRIRTKGAVLFGKTVDCVFIDCDARRRACK